jgi:hypothetical protein
MLAVAAAVALIAERWSAAGADDADAGVRGETEAARRSRTPNIAGVIAQCALHG